MPNQINRHIDAIGENNSDVNAEQILQELKWWEHINPEVIDYLSLKEFTEIDKSLGDFRMSEMYTNLESDEKAKVDWLARKMEEKLRKWSKSIVLWSNTFYYTPPEWYAISVDNKSQEEQYLLINHGWDDDLDHRIDLSAAGPDNILKLVLDDGMELSVTWVWDNEYSLQFSDPTLLGKSLVKDETPWWENTITSHWGIEDIESETAEDADISYQNRQSPAADNNADEIPNEETKPKPSDEPATPQAPSDQDEFEEDESKETWEWDIANAWEEGSQEDDQESQQTEEIRPDEGRKEKEIIISEEELESYSNEEFKNLYTSVIKLQKTGTTTIEKRTTVEIESKISDLDTKLKLARDSKDELTKSDENLINEAEGVLKKLNNEKSIKQLLWPDALSTLRGKIALFFMNSFWIKAWQLSKQWNQIIEKYDNSAKIQKELKDNYKESKELWLEVSFEFDLHQDTIDNKDFTDKQREVERKNVAASNILVENLRSIWYFKDIKNDKITLQIIKDIINENTEIFWIEKIEWKSPNISSEIFEKMNEFDDMKILKLRIKNLFTTKEKERLVWVESNKLVKKFWEALEDKWIIISNTGAREKEILEVLDENKAVIMPMVSWLIKSLYDINNKYNVNLDDMGIMKEIKPFFSSSNVEDIGKLNTYVEENRDEIKKTLPVIRMEK